VNVSKFSAVHIGHNYPPLSISCTYFFQSPSQHHIRSATGRIVSIKLFNERPWGIELVTSMPVAVVAIACKLILFKFLDVVELFFFNFLTINFASILRKTLCLMHISTINYLFRL
jgi:hypothetical protein